MAHKIKKGDEIQACGKGQPWVIGTFVSYVDGVLTLDGVVPLYGNRNVVYESLPSKSFEPTCVYVYGEGQAPILTWAPQQGDLSKFIAE